MAEPFSGTSYSQRKLNTLDVVKQILLQTQILSSQIIKLEKTLILKILDGVAPLVAGPLPGTPPLCKISPKQQISVI